MESNALTDLVRKAEYFKEYYRDNAAKIKANKAKYSAENKDKLNEQTRQWHKQNPEKSLLTSAKNRAKRAGVPFNLELEDIQIPEQCPILGVQLVTKAGKRTDSTPSLDRKTPGKGYVKGNVAIISWRANRLKNDGTIEELEKIVAYMNGA